MNRNYDFSEVLEVAAAAGHILLENGAEISRVEDIMTRIASYYGVDSGNFFVLSNGIFTTGSAGKMKKIGSQAASYANVEFIPIKGIRLDKVVAVNDLSYEIASGKHTLESASKRLEEIRVMRPKPLWEQVLGSAFGAAGFCIVFGGGWMDAAAAFAVGGLLYLFILLVSSRYLSKIVGGICNALLATLLCLLTYRIGFGPHLSNIIIGAIMPLVPGVPFVNGVRDLANSDYIAGITRLTDAMLGFFCIAIGVSVGFLLDGVAAGGLIPLTYITAQPETAGLLAQVGAAFVGTAAFAVLFGVPDKEYVTSGIIGAFGWLVYLLLVRYVAFTPSVATLAAAFAVCLTARKMAVLRRCPGTVYLLCGIFPLVPGAGIFWFSYYLISSQFALSQSAGFSAAKIAIAIVLGIILATELPQRLFSPLRKKGDRG